MRGLLGSALCCLWAASGFAQGLDEATIQPDTRTGLERLMTRAGFGDIQKSYALIVGVSDFEHYADLPTFDDPMRMHDYLIDEAGFDYVHILTEDKVTKARLEELMVDEFRPLVGPNDRFLLYWSGHGETQEVGGSDMGFLPLANSQQATLSGMVAMSDLTRWNRYINAHQVLYLLDSCFSGLAGAAPQSDLSDITREQLSGPGRHLITAGRMNEQTIAIDDLGGSIFTHALLKGLRGAADTTNELGSDGLIAVGELKGYLGQEIGRLRQVYNWQKTITPQIRDLEGSDGAFFFPVPASFPAPVDVAADAGEVVPQGGGVIPQSGGDRDLIEVQLALAELGYDPGEADGILGFATRRALIAFQTDHGLVRSGEADRATVLKLLLTLVPVEDETPPEAAFDDGVVAALSTNAPLTTVKGVELAAIPAANFVMGRDDGRPEQGPSRNVQISPFHIATTETTMAIFGQYIEAEGLDFVSRKMEPDPTCYAWGEDNRLRRTAYAYNQLRNTPEDYPVSCVNLDDISGFLDWLNSDLEGPPFRLPTEAEFEFLLSKAQANALGPLWAIPEQVCEIANVADAGTNFAWRNDSCDDGDIGVTSVGQFDADAFGLFDLRGNLWEWVSDCWRPSHDAAEPPEACETGTVRGGSFDDPIDNLHQTIRQPVPVKRRQTNIGFRLARDAP